MSMLRDVLPGTGGPSVQAGTRPATCWAGPLAPMRRTDSVHNWRMPMFRTAALVAAVLFPISALATPISVHNTGVNSSDVLVAPGAQTAFWTLFFNATAATE